MVSWDGTQEIQLTSSPDSESQPRWSPDNKYLVVRLVAAGREGRPDLAAEPRRRRGRQAQRRQGRRLRLRLVARQQAPRARRRASPIRAIRRTTRRTTAGQEEDRAADRHRPLPLQGRTSSGYLRGERTHLYLFDVATKKAEALTPGALRRGVARRGRPTARRSRSSASAATAISIGTNNTDVCVDRREGRRAAAPADDVAGADGQRPRRWSPDGKQIAYLAGEELKYSAYNQEQARGHPGGRRPAAAC